MNVYMNANAMQTASYGIAVAADNIANINTDGFRASSVRYETGAGGYGVRLGEIRENSTPGPLYDRYDGSGSVEASNTDVAREMTNLITEQRMYEANAVPLRVYDDLLGTLVDIRA